MGYVSFREGKTYFLSSMIGFVAKSLAQTFFFHLVSQGFRGGNSIKREEI